MESMLGSSGDVIAAISTPPGTGGIAVIRISGPGAFHVANKVFTPASPRRKATRGWQARYGRVHDGNGVFIDEAILLTMPAPRSYTREDVAEISCHGGTAVAAAVLEAIISAGARRAAPGEFTKRAVLNGRISLLEAEGVLQMVNARTERARDEASRFLRGRGGEVILKAREQGMRLMAAIEAWIDFPEDDVPPVDEEALRSQCAELAHSLHQAAREAAMSRVLWEGVSVAIVGRPNVGKSRLLNALLGEERAIVSDQPGTTRDIVSEVANIRGIPVKLVDTAGMRRCADAIEAMGVERARGALADADIALAVVDGSRPLEAEDLEIVQSTTEERSILVVNKSDLPSAISSDEIEAAAGGRLWIRASALTGSGLDRLEDAIESLALSRSVSERCDGATLSRHRLDCIQRAAAAFDEAAEGASVGYPLDVLSIDLRAALDALGEITGETTREDVIDLLFSEFCVGK